MQLNRDIGFWGSAFLVLNGLVGAGIFALPQRMADQLGSFSPWAFLLFGGLMLTVVWCLGQLAGRFSMTGGPVVYAEAAFGDAVSFQTGWLYYLARATAIAANMHVLLLYASYVWPALGQGYGQMAAVLVLTFLLVAVNIVGIRSALRALDGLTLLKLTPFLLLLGVGFYQVPPDWQIPVMPEIDAFGVGALLVLYAFIGFENAVVTAGETQKPGMNIPKALFWTVITIALFYFLIQLLYWNVMQGKAVEGAPLVALANELAGRTGAIVLTLAAVVSVGGNLLANVISTSRLTYALAEEKVLPASFARIHPRYATPDVSIYVLGLIACVLALSGSFVWLAVASVLARLLVYVVCIVSLVKLHFSSEERATNSHLKRLLFVFVPAIAMAVCLWALAQSTQQAWLYLFFEVLLGALLYWSLKRRSVSR